MLTPEERTLRAKLAAHELHARHDSHEITAKARASFQARFETQVDPEGILPEDERKRRAEHARKAHYIRMALKSAQVRRAKARASERMAHARATKGNEKPPIEEAASELEV